MKRTDISAKTPENKINTAEIPRLNKSDLIIKKGSKSIKIADRATNAKSSLFIEIAASIDNATSRHRMLNLGIAIIAANKIGYAI
ncbi:hypothetical protein D3C80_1816580 [compost metagenome]